MILKSTWLADRRSLLQQRPKHVLQMTRRPNPRHTIVDSIGRPYKKHSRERSEGKHRRYHLNIRVIADFPKVVVRHEMSTSIPSPYERVLWNPMLSGTNAMYVLNLRYVVILTKNKLSPRVKCKAIFAVVCS